MHILDLPYEILSKIIAFSILARHRALRFGRGMNRAVRLKFVCKEFYNLFQSALFRTRVLDDPKDYESLQLWPIKHLHGREKMRHKYLVYRVRNEKEPKIGRFVDIANIAKEFLEVAEEFCKAAKVDDSKIVDDLCWLVLESATGCPGNSKFWDRELDDALDPFDPPGPRDLLKPHLNLLSIAAYFNHLDLARNLLDKGCCPIEHDLFPSPMYSAAYAGNKNMVILFQENIMENFPGVEPGTGTVEGAALRGDIDMFRLATRGIQKGYPSILMNVPFWTQNPKIFTYTQKFFDSPPVLPTSLLCWHAECGNPEMVKCLLDNRWEVGRWDDGEEALTNSYALVKAVRMSQEDVVDLLLERGVSLNVGDLLSTSALSAAAAAGSMSMLRKLIKHGANNDNYMWDQRTMLLNALLLEHTEMVNLFFEMGVFGGNCPQSIRERVQKDGLESMVELLKGWGSETELDPNFRRLTFEWEYDYCVKQTKSGGYFEPFNFLVNQIAVLD
ncbi:ankyrin repeat-containing domain protein [Xylaria digitata]|nr:ankyrin repeat-containing domain protein [Xylaria digitata]